MPAWSLQYRLNTERQAGSCDYKLFKGPVQYFSKQNCNEQVNSQPRVRLPLQLKLSTSSLALSAKRKDKNTDGKKFCITRVRLFFEFNSSLPSEYGCTYVAFQFLFGRRWVRSCSWWPDILQEEFSIRYRFCVQVE